MARTKRAQILMDPKEYAQLERLASRAGSSVGELIRTAVREKYLSVSPRSIEAADRICRMRLPVTDWSDTEREIAEAHGDGLS